MKVLITGGLGFIGTYAANRLVQLGHEVVTFDTLPSAPPQAAELLKGTTHFRGDLLNQLSLFEAVKKYKIDRIMHLAALRNNDSQLLPHLAFRLNCEGTMNCYEAARIFGLERVVFASTTATVGSADFYKQMGISELEDHFPTRPINVYGVTKSFDEMMGREYSKIYGLNIVGCRLALIYGPGKKPGSKTSLWNDLIENSIKGEAMEMSDMSGLPVSINYAKDSAEAVLAATVADHPQSGTYNCTGHCVTSTQFCEAIKRVIPGADITMKSDGKTPNTMGVFNVEGAKREFNYSPIYTLEQGIEDHVKTLAAQK